MQSKSDEELMCLYRDGDEAAFNFLYARYSSRVYGFLHKKLRDPQAANDIFQVIFTKLHRSRDQYNKSFPFAPWLFTIARNAMLDYLRSGQATERVRSAFEQQLEQQLDQPLNQHSERESGHDTLGSDERVALDSLSDAQRAAIEMRYYEELPFEEIAKRLETSPTNVRQLVSRGVRQLKNSFKKNGQSTQGGNH